MVKLEKYVTKPPSRHLVVQDSCNLQVALRGACCIRRALNAFFGFFTAGVFLLSELRISRPHPLEAQFTHHLCHVLFNATWLQFAAFMKIIFRANGLDASEKDSDNKSQDASHAYDEGARGLANGQVWKQCPWTDTSCQKHPSMPAATSYKRGTFLRSLRV